MRVAGQIVEYVMGATKRWFSVDDPIFTEQRPQEGTECFRVCKRFEFTRKHELALPEQTLQAGDELAAKDATEHLYRQEESVAWTHPLRMIRRQAARWNNAVNVRVMQ